MRPDDDFRNKPPEFWALVKLVSQEIGYSHRRTRSVPSRVRAYSPGEVISALRGRGLEPRDNRKKAEEVAWYSTVRADLLQNHAEPNLMGRDEAREVFEDLRAQISPPEALLPMNKQKGSKRHFAYLTGIVNMLTWQALTESLGQGHFDWDPRGPLTFSRDGMPLRTLFRRMDGAYPGLNQPVAAWEIKEYYGTTTFGSRVADGVYETALDGYELNDLRDVGVEVEHYLFLDDRFTWWDCGKSYLCRIVDMLHAGLLDGAFVGREVIAEWPVIVSQWPTDDSPGEQKSINDLL
jgi:hypothetical protein